MEPITLITCTGDRPEAFALCERWMSRKRQITAAQWIVVDDGQTPTKLNYCQQLVRPAQLWEGQQTMVSNLRLALPLVRHEKVLFIEDDDYYSDLYVSQMTYLLNHCDVAGEIPARYYNVVARRYRELPNLFHASLSQTAIRSSQIPALLSICEINTTNIDMRFWRGAEKKLVSRIGCSVGIKGMPGRAGIGIGHQAEQLPGRDPDAMTLRCWVGPDAKHYEQFYQQDKGVAA